MRDLIVSAPIIFGFWSVAVWLYRFGHAAPISTLESMATIVGGGGIFVAAFGVFYQGRVKSRAENRQAWINELRSALNDVIAEMPAPIAVQRKHGIRSRGTSRDDAMQRMHAKIEMYLNPSERVHRAFMAVMRHAYRASDLPIDKEVAKYLWGKDMEERPDIDDEKQWHEMKSDIIRLANVLLKREWEQVKQIA